MPFIWRIVQVSLFFPFFGSHVIYWFLDRERVRTAAKNTKCVWAKPPTTTTKKERSLQEKVVPLIIVWLLGPCWANSSRLEAQSDFEESFFLVACLQVKLFCKIVARVRRWNVNQNLVKNPQFDTFSHPECSAEMSLCWRYPFFFSNAGHSQGQPS